MSKSETRQMLPRDKNPAPAGMSTVDRFAALLPELCYAMNRVLEDATPGFSKKVGVALWALIGSNNLDEFGRFLMTRHLVATFRDWFVVSKKSANSEVARVKADLWGLRYIKIEGGNDHIHLNEKGERAALEMLARARSIIQTTIGTLTPEEQSALLNFASRMIAAKKPPLSQQADKDPRQLKFPAS
jgi:hypothetical protein